MTLEGAINLNEANDYIIYAVNSVEAGQYGVVVPKNVNGTLNMLVDLHMKSSFDAISNGSKTREELVNEIVEEYNKLKGKYNDGMLVIPMIDEALFQNIVVGDDKQKMFDEVKKIGNITKELYAELIKQGVDKQKIDQKIIIVEKNEIDDKFVTWLKGQMPNFVDGIKYSELIVTLETPNLFNVDNIFGTAPQVAQPEVVVEQTPVVDLFGGQNPAPVVEKVVEQTVPVEPVVSTQDVITSAQSQQPSVVSPVIEAAQPVVQSVFEQPTSVPVQPVAQPQNVVTPVQPQQPSVATPVTEVVQQTVEAPRAVSPAELEGTIAFTPIPNHPNNPIAEEQADVLVKKKSKGFVNLAILLGVLVGVTIVSIELGKYLYSVFGA